MLKLVILVAYNAEIYVGTFFRQPRIADLNCLSNNKPQSRIEPTRGSIKIEG